MIVRGPFDIKWGDNTVEDVEELDLSYEVSSDDFETLGGRTIEIDGSVKVTAVLTLLKSDIPALAALLPQNFIPDGGVMSTGETVNHAEGAMDFSPLACDADIIYNNLDIISCGNPSKVFRVVNARTRFEDLDVDNKVGKCMVKVIGEAPQGEAGFQMFTEGTIAVVS